MPGVPDAAPGFAPDAVPGFAMGGDALVVLTTFPSDAVAGDIARKLVGERLAACVNLVPGVRSIYAWKGEVHDDAEVLGIVKTQRALADALVARLTELHPYDTPEVVALEPRLVEARYLAWLLAGTGPKAEEQGEA